MAKTHVAPLNNPTLPRLELMAALIVVLQAKFMSNSLKLQDVLFTFEQIVK